MTFPKLCPKLHSDSEGLLISLTDSCPAIVGSLPLLSKQQHQLMLRAIFQRNPRAAKDKSTCSELYPVKQQQTMSCISLPRFSGPCSKMAGVTRKWLHGNTPDFFLNSSFKAPDSEDEMEVGVQIHFNLYPL